MCLIGLFKGLFFCSQCSLENNSQINCTQLQDYPHESFSPATKSKLLLVVECWSTSVVNIAKALYGVPLNFHFPFLTANVTVFAALP